MLGGIDASKRSMESCEAIICCAPEEGENGKRNIKCTSLPRGLGRFDFELVAVDGTYMVGAL